MNVGQYTQQTRLNTWQEQINYLIFYASILHKWNNQLKISGNDQLENYDKVVLGWMSFVQRLQNFFLERVGNGIVNKDKEVMIKWWAILVKCWGKMKLKGLKTYGNWGLTSLIPSAKTNSSISTKSNSPVRQNFSTN